ncbi:MULTISPECIES: hypothetical protein [Streptomyces]|uniref:Uncharacterized protein n=1 Tax=Streptomyces lonegramiae TaxID=3075524 RepID=A0ABU2X788_9ACTN|nr:hypothetical protein [Streptomyces sp. DSM 41529]MDT0541793.1 hypothetical protein [Streptomyces sp. DSM 41529]
MKATKLENDITDQWAQLFPVAGYTSGWPQNKDIACRSSPSGSF